jgi:hypothetical protein
VYAKFSICGCVFVFLAQAISCFFSVLRQLKIVKPTRQPGEKTNKLKKTKLISILYGLETTKGIV